MEMDFGSLKVRLEVVCVRCDEAVSLAAQVARRLWCGSFATYHMAW